jgi:hypothetical protein
MMRAGSRKCYLESVLNCCCTYLVTLSVSTMLRRVIPVLGRIVIHCKGALFKSMNFWYLLVKKWYISVKFNMDYLEDLAPREQV